MTAWRVAAAQALASVRRQPGRFALVALGCLLGAAFFAAVHSVRLIEATQSVGGGDAARLWWFECVAALMTVCGVASGLSMSVLERFPEIGALKCLGATNGLVALTFMIEGFLVAAPCALVGATLGSALGARLASHAAPLVGWSDSALTFLVVVFVSILVPGAVAARLQPIVALRSEI